MATPDLPADQPAGAPAAQDEAKGADHAASNEPMPVAEGVLITAAGEVRVDEGLTETLLDLAETLEDRTGRPVDVEHVVAAVVMANRAGKIGSDRRLRTGDDLLLMALVPQIEAIFTRYGGLVAEPGEEDADAAAPDDSVDSDLESPTDRS